MYKLLASIWVKAPPEAVFAYYADPANWQPTLPALLELEMEGEPPFRLGTRWRQKRRFLWMIQDSTGEVVRFEPPEWLEYTVAVAKLTEAGGRLTAAHHFGSEGEGTRWSVGAQLEMPQPMPGWVEWMFYTPMRWSAARDIAAFKKRIERERA